MYANVFPRQISTIPFGWTNKTTDAGTFVVSHPGRISMPHLEDYFDWTRFSLEEVAPGRPFGTRNFKSIFTTASRFLGLEELLIQKPALFEITEEFIAWNLRLLQTFPIIRFFHIGDDFAGNNGLFMSPRIFRSWLLPEYKKLVGLAREYNLQVIFHSDGDIFEVFDDLCSLHPDYFDYQPVGKMVEFSFKTEYKCVKLIENSEEEQSHTHEDSMKLQKESSK